MVKLLRRLFICAAALLAISVHAKDPAAYQVGDKAEDDISTPVALDVIDAQATAALKSSEVLKTPAIFESFPGVTNEIAMEFLAAFAAARLDFNAQIQNSFHQTTLTNETIASPDFGYFVTAFNVENKKFPITTALARIWARGGDDSAERNKLLNSLLQIMNRPIRPDNSPFALGDTLRLVPVKNSAAKPTLEDAERRGEIVTVPGVITLSIARAQWRREFSEEDQLFARTLSEFLVPNCAPDENLTQLARNRAIAGLVVDDHFDAGQIIVHRGAIIDSQTKAALDELDEKLMPGVLNKQIAAEHQRAQQEEEQAQRAQEQAQLAQQQQQQAQQERDRAQTEAQRDRAQAAAMRQAAFLAQSQAREIRIRNEWLAVAIAGVSILALLILWRLLRQRRPTASSISASATLQRAEKSQTVMPAEFAPHLAQAVKEALVQELAAQRHEMLSVQQTATSEIAQLVHRLDQLQTPLHERLRTYELQIQQLEKELAARTEENRELLRMKIEMMRRQLEAERKRVDFN